MSVKYISDLHLYDIDSIDWRPQFNNLDSFAMLLLDKWNAFTLPSDTVIVVGDIGTPCTRTINVLSKLNGNKILVKGNHDIIWGRELYTCGIFSGIYDNITIDNLYITHIPENVPHNTGYIIHGHHHRYDTPNMSKVLMQYVADTYRLNCCADLVDLRPRTLQDLALCKEILIDSYINKGIIKGD